MKKEKQSELLIDSLEFLEDDMLQEVEGLRGKHFTEKRKRRNWRRWVAVAASACVLITGYWLAEEFEILDSLNPEAGSEATTGKSPEADGTSEVLDPSAQHNGPEDESLGFYEISQEGLDDAEGIYVEIIEKELQESNNQYTFEKEEEIIIGETTISIGIATRYYVAEFQKNGKGYRVIGKGVSWEEFIEAVQSEVEETIDCGME